MKKLNVVVKKGFTDRYTGLKRKANDKMTITEDRFREIQRSGDYVEIEKTVAKTEKATAEIKK